MPIRAARSRAPGGEARGRRRQQDTRVRKELRQIYRDALEDLTREPGTDPGSKKER